MGRALKDKAPKADHPIIQDMLNQLKGRWNGVCNRAVERQRELEEALLFSGQFKDALQALLDWLYKVGSEIFVIDYKTLYHLPVLDGLQGDIIKPMVHV